MLLIWGWKTRLKTLGEGVFFSPAAGGDGPYRLVEARRWFTIFFIPVIPLKVLGNFVECRQTGATYDPSVLNNLTNAQLMEELSGAMREAIALVLAFGPPATAAQRKVAIDLVREHIPDYGDAHLDQDLAGVANAPIDQRLTFLAGELDVNGKERLLTAVATVMATDADGDSSEGVRAEAVRGVGEKLGMTPVHIRGVITAAASSIAP